MTDGINKIIYTNIIPSIKGDKERKTVIILLENNNNKLHYLLYGESISEDTILILDRITRDFPYFTEFKANLNVDLVKEKDNESIFKLICLDTIENKKPMTIKEIEEKLGYNITVVG